MFNDRVSVVMITHNRGSRIRTALEHLLRLPEQPRIVVVDNNSSDETVEVARAMGSRVEVIALDRNLGGAGRNLGVARVKTPYVAFSDDDSWWQPGALKRATDLFDSHPALGLVAARILVGPDERLEPLCQIMALDLPPVERSCEAQPSWKPAASNSALAWVAKRKFWHWIFCTRAGSLLMWMT